jgi:uncharacterized protein YbbK (DUF523 family)/uncharacterized protein YbgA (DUF1722 family)
MSIAFYHESCSDRLDLSSAAAYIPVEIYNARIPDASEMTEKDKIASQISIGVSACLLGHEVRYDGGHKRDPYITNILGEFFRVVSICPEADAGLGIPRETIDLYGSPESPRMIGNESGTDFTAQIKRYSGKRVREDDVQTISGFILKSNSPSCGMERVKVFEESGNPICAGRGIFADALMKKYPFLPVEDEKRLRDRKVRENFITRVLAHHRMQIAFKGRISKRKIEMFHAVHKCALLAHSPKHYELLENMIADSKHQTAAEIRDKYLALFMEALKVKTTRAKNENVLRQILALIEDSLDSDERDSALLLIESYRFGGLDLHLPLRLLRSYAEKYNLEHILYQTYFDSYLVDVMLDDIAVSPESLFRLSHAPGRKKR